MSPPPARWHHLPACAEEIWHKGSKHSYATETQLLSSPRGIWGVLGCCLLDSGLLAKPGCMGYGPFGFDMVRSSSMRLWWVESLISWRREMS